MRLYDLIELALVYVLACYISESRAAAGPPSAVSQPPPVRLALDLDRGICIDRQFRTIPPEPIMRITRADIALIKSMGFEFVKLIINPEPLMTAGHLDTAKRGYLDQIINLVTAEQLPVVVCIHPEWEFKRTTLNDRAAFAQFLLFLQDLGEYLAARWTPRQLALQLMTEPVTDIIPWNDLQPQMWQVARRALPDHTLILAGDQVGKLEGLLATAPVDDANVIYSFTFYDPFLFTLQGGEWLTPAWWAHLGPVPYPSSPERIKTQLPRLLARIPPEPPDWRIEVARNLQRYGAATWNRQSIAARVRRLAEWNHAHGGRLKIWCAEFGCYQRTVAPKDRYQYLRDVRDAFEQNGIGWAYWSYNETLTVMTSERVPFGPAERQQPDRQLLKVLLDR